MKIFLTPFFVVFLNTAIAQLNNKYFGIWQPFREPLSVSQFPEIRGRLCNFYWKDIETNPGVWNWTSFDSNLALCTQDGLPVIFMVYVRGPHGDAPAWLFSHGVPKVIIKDKKGNISGSSPYYADSIYKSYFKKMIIAVHQHLETLPSSVRSRIIGVQCCFGSTDEFISYPAGVVPLRFVLTQKQFSDLFKEFTQYYFDEYKKANPKIAVLSNPGN
ncbi:MAG TPA: beta-galactosidase, partial [Chitinophagaceae bacterium]